MKILLPTDGSRHALAAARALSGWFDWPGGEIDVLAVAPEERKSDRRHFGRDTEIDQDWRSTVGRWLDDTVTHLGASGLRTRRLTRVGEPVEVVLDVASEGYDLTAVGAKGRGDEPSLDEGSVARAVLDHAATWVLLVRERKASGRQRRLPTRQRPLRILFAVDGGTAADAAVSAYSKLIPIEHADVTVLAVADAAEGGALGEPDAHKIVRRITSELAGHGIEAEPQVAAGAPASQILVAAEDADLVVLGSRASPEPPVLPLDSVGLAVALATPCSVLIVRGAAPEGFIAAVQEEVQAATPFEIAYEGLEPSPAAERHVLRGVGRLERVAPDLMAVRVTLATHYRRHRTGNLYDVSLVLALPGPDVVVSRTPPSHSEDEDLVVAIGEAFEKARRKLVDLHQVERGDVKSHEAGQYGRVSDLFPEHGFIKDSGGRIVYFHRNSVTHDAWDDLEVGVSVRFLDEPGEEGPHATTVTVVGHGETVES